MKTLNLSCVDIQHSGAEEILKKTSHMTDDQELKFWHERTQYLREMQKKNKKKQRLFDKESA